MSHPVNDELLENLYEDLTFELKLNDQLSFYSESDIEAEVMRRFEAMSM